MRGERQRDLVVTDVNVRMVIHFFRAFGDAPHKSDAHQEVLKLEGAADGFCAVRPIGNGFQLNGDLSGGQGGHNFISDGD